MNNISEKSLTEKLNEKAKQAYKHDPVKLKYFLAVNSKEVIFASPAIVEMLTESINGVKQALDINNHSEIIDVIKSYSNSLSFKKAPACATPLQSFMSKIINVIAVNENVTFYTDSKNYTIENHIIGSFIHELGHLLMENGFPIGHDGTCETAPFYTQCIAEYLSDTLKGIEHKADNGNNTDYAYNQNYSENIVLGTSPIHYTNVVNQAVENIALKEDFSLLSFGEKIKRAEEITLKYKLDEDTLNRIYNAFIPVILYYHKEPKDIKTLLDLCFDVMIKNKKDHDVYRTGKKFLESSVIKTYIDRKSDFWIDAYEQMTKFEKESGITLDLAKAVDERLAAEVTAKQIKTKKPRNLAHCAC